MAKEIFKNLPNTSTPLSASKLNGLFDGEESMGSIVVEDIQCKNLFSGYLTVLAFAPYISLPKGTYTITEIDTASGNWYFKAYKDGSVLSSGVSFSESFSWSDASSCWYKADATLQGFTFTLSEDCVVQIGRLNADGTQKVQLEKGSVATNFVEHKEFSNKQIYSTSEQVIGTWIDGKPLYRKVININSLPNNANQNYATGLTHGTHSIKNFYGCYTNGQYDLGINEYSGSNYIRTVIAYTLNIQITTNSDKSSYSGFVVIEYTKTTD